MVFFDLGWTLEDETPGQEKRAQETVEYCRSLGIPVTSGQMLRFQAEAGARGAPAVYPEALLSLGLGPDHHSILRQLHPWDPGLNRLYPEVPGILETLARGCSLGILANQSRPMGPRLANYGILRFFRVLVCSSEVGLEKPDPEIFRLADRLAGDSGPHWMVGDRVDNDIVPAKALGWKTIRVIRGDYRLYKSSGDRESPDFEIHSLAEVPGLLGL